MNDRFFPYASIVIPVIFFTLVVLIIKMLNDKGMYGVWWATKEFKKQYWNQRLNANLIKKKETPVATRFYETVTNLATEHRKDYSIYAQRHSASYHIYIFSEEERQEFIRLLNINKEANKRKHLQAVLPSEIESCQLADIVLREIELDIKYTRIRKIT